jgi:hypothetical protein
VQLLRAVGTLDRIQQTNRTTLTLTAFNQTIGRNEKNVSKGIVVKIEKGLKVRGGIFTKVLQSTGGLWRSTAGEKTSNEPAD